MLKKGAIVAAIFLGIGVGVGLYTFQYAEGLSYFSKDPNACINCHIMQPQFDSWQNASHHTSASCVDCHLPQSGISKFIAKADNGYRHSKGFTFQDFHEPIMVNDRNKKILQDNCLRCHDAMVHGILGASPSAAASLQCVHCHSGVGHGERAGMGRFENITFLRGQAHEGNF
jgi:cytochrome c nitrite reductase small subunit